MILNIIRKTVRDYNILSEGDSVVVGLSGGADSVCLTHALNTLKDELGITVYTAHVNHGIRGAEAARDEEFAKTFSESLGIKCFTLSADIPSIAKEQGISEETAGRQIRYDFFKNLCEKHGIDKIATAHNKNDNAETVLMNFMRGSSLKGLSGIPFQRENIIRPVLNADRVQIEEYCRKNNLKYMTDSTNNDSVYTRNKIRHTLIPLIEQEFNPNFVSTVFNNTVLISEDGAYIEKKAAEEYRKLSDGNSVPVETLSALDNAVKRRVIRCMIQAIRGTTDDIPAVYVSDVMSMLEKNSGSSVNLSDGIVARIEYGSLIIEHEKQPAAPFEYTFKCNSTGIIEEISKEVIISDAVKRQKDGSVYIGCDKADKITVRSRREGDIFYPSGMTGSKKVKEYLINKKIPRDERNAVPIIEIDGQIAAVGDRVDRRYLFQDKGIKIEFRPMREVMD